MKRALLVALLLVCSVQAYAQREQQLPLRNDRESVSRLYAMLSQSGVNAKDVYGSLTPDVQADLWMLQLEEFLASSPELTAEQRSLTMETIGLLASGVLDRYASSSAQVSKAASAEVSRLSARAVTVFSKPARLAFAELNHEAVRTAVSALRRETAQERAEPKKLEAGTNAVGKVATQSTFECNCNSYVDTCGFTDCVFVPQACIRKPAGCGWMWAEACNGWCNV